MRRDDPAQVGGRLVAWVTRRGDGFVAAFIGEHATQHRRPATRGFATREEAEAWITRQAATMGLPVKWGERDEGPAQ